MTDPLQKLFGSPARVKLLRLFLFNPRQAFTVPESAQHARLREREARKEITLFASLGLVKRQRRPLRAKGVKFMLSEEFAYVSALQNLLLNAPERGVDIYERVRRSGSIKLVVLSGIFMGEWEGRLDILIVGDRIKEHLLNKAIRRLESEVGKELRYAVLSTEEFFYRLNLSDHLVRDVLDYPHKIVADKLQIGLK